jgi:predicted aspartyl protease
MLTSILLAAMAVSTHASQSTTVPFTLFDNRMLVGVSLNGIGPFAMIVDTGSDALVVTPSVARRLALITRAAGSATGAGSGSAAVAQTRIASVAIGALRFREIPTEVIDLSPIQRAIGFPRLDGIVGYSILRRLRVGVDMNDGTLTLSSAPLSVPKTAATVSFTINRYGLIQIPAAVDGVHGTFVIDTGDRSSLTLFAHFAQANNFYRDAPVRNAITGIGVGGPIYSDVLRTTVSLFGSTVSGVVTRASRDRGGVFALAPQDASIGTGLLRRFNIVYDYPKKELFAWPSRFFSAADEYRPLAFEHGALHVERNAADPTSVASPGKPPA